MAAADRCAGGAGRYLASLPCSLTSSRRPFAARPAFTRWQRDSGAAMLSIGPGWGQGQPEASSGLFCRVVLMARHSPEWRRQGGAGVLSLPDHWMFDAPTCHDTRWRDVRFRRDRRMVRPPNLTHTISRAHSANAPAPSSTPADASIVPVACRLQQKNVDPSTNQPLSVDQLCPNRTVRAPDQPCA